MKKEDREADVKDIISRRKLLKAGLAVLAATLIPFEDLEAAGNFFSARSLFIYNDHTGDYINDYYYKNGSYLRSAIAKINYIFRDHYTGIVCPINATLLDILYVLQRRLGNQYPFHLISGYRSPQTNAYLRRNNKNVAEHSLHMYGMAADITLPGHDLDILYRAAKGLRAGGVGYYPRSNFVHIDSGRVRYW